MKQKALDSLRLNHRKKNMVLSSVSGILTTEPGMIRHFAEHVPSCDIITTKSYQLKATSGHREPVICSPSEGTYGNFVGLRNPGLDAVLPDLKRIRAENPKFILNVSLAANSIEDFIGAIERVDGLADIVELNFSCPHAGSGFGASIGMDSNIAGEYAKRICESFKQRDFLIIPKLTPNAKDIAAVAKAVIAGGADGVALVNTMGPYEYNDASSGEAIFNRCEGGKGGMSGAQVKQTALSCIRKVRDAIGDEPIILGMGGVSSSLDTERMLEAGADSIGLGSVLASV
ncbi:MAG TPA: dihydroorotate dehydrogenase, partial [Spirochaetaceae bacterium]|nr:dihydroorotate dehydrogenase [Spirochaetaceae bacterium]